MHHQNDLVSQVSFFPDTPSPTDWVHPKGIAAGHSWTISNSLVNNFRYGLTRDSFTLGGDANTNGVFFRFIYEPRDFTYSTSRTTPVHNFTDDLSWTRGNHSMQYGTNIRLVRNNRLSFGGSYDYATTTQAAYRRIARACVNNARNASGACTQGAIGGGNNSDYTTVQAIWDDGLGFGDNLFIHPQYATFYAYSTIGTSDYHAAQFSFRKRFSRGSYFDFNYTLSHSYDLSSSTETGDFPSGYIAGGNAVILQPLDLNSNRAQSDFDVRHLINANFGYDLPFGRGRRYFSGMSKVANSILGGWKLTGIYRWNSGFPLLQPYDDGRWATNWNVQSNGVAIRPLKTSPTRTGDPNAFSDPVAAYRSYRNAYPGEIGDRNQLRGMSFVQLDTGVMKIFDLPWEDTRVVFRWDVFNLTNTQRFSGVLAANRLLGRDPYADGVPSADFGKFTRILGTPRVMQFALRIEF